MPLRLNTFSYYSNLQGLKDLIKEKLKWKMACYSSSNRKNSKVEGFNFSLVNMSRHLEHRHWWGKAKQKHGLSRKNYIVKNPLKKAKTSEKENGQIVKIHKNLYQKRLCPVVGCQSENKIMPAHLQGVTFLKGRSDFHTGYMP